jgi:hypothetical protein
VLENIYIDNIIDRNGINNSSASFFEEYEQPTLFLQ